MGKDSEFLDAARNGNLQIIEKILISKARKSGPLASLRRGPGANVQDSCGYTALHHAALNGHRTIVSTLLRHEASVNIQDNKGSTPLHLAAWAGHEHVIKIILTQGPSIPNVNHQNKAGDTALHFAAQYGHTETSKLLLRRGADPALPNLKAETPLDLAAQFGRLAVTDLLLRQDGDLARRFSAAATAVYPHTPLHLAARNGHLGVVKSLLNHGHQVNIRTSQGSALHEAAICGKVDVVRALMEAGADADVRNDLGLTVLDTIASINTPVTHEISALIKSKHAGLIDIDEDVTCEKPTKISPLTGSGILPLILNPNSCPCPIVATTLSLTSPTFALTIDPLSFNCLPSSGHDTPGYKKLTPEYTLNDNNNCPIMTNFDPESVSLRDEICVYENFLVPSRLRTRVGDQPMRTVERRPKVKRARSNSSSRRSTERRPPPVANGRDNCSLRLPDSRDSDYRSSGDGDDFTCRSDSSSIYDAPATGRAKSRPVSAKSSLSVRSNSHHDILEDDNEGVYEDPPPPRPCSATLRAPPKDPSIDGDSSKSGSAPPKPPRRSICPPSPGNNVDSNSDQNYEMICFATSGENRSRNTGSSARPGENRLSGTNGSNGGRRAPPRCSRGVGATSDSDSDSGVSSRFESGSADHNQGYSSMRFKPVKSRRTARDLREAYENTKHSYENFPTHAIKNDKLSGSLALSPNWITPLSLGLPQADNSNRNDVVDCSAKNMIDNSNWNNIESDYGVIKKRHASPVNRSCPAMTPVVPPYPSNNGAYVDSVTKDKLPSPPSAQQACNDIGKRLHRPPQEEPDNTLSNPEDTLAPEEPPVLRWGPERSRTPPVVPPLPSCLNGRSASTDTIEAICEEEPFAGLLRGSRSSSDWPYALLKAAQDSEGPVKAPSAASPAPENVGSSDEDGANKWGSRGASPDGCSDEEGDWSQIGDIMASFGNGVARESVFMAELEQEFQQRLGLSLSPSQQSISLLSSSGGAVSPSRGGSSSDSGPDPMDVGVWLSNQSLSSCEHPLTSNGFDRTDFLNTDISELKEKLFCELPQSTSRERRPPETASNTVRRVPGKRKLPPPPPPKAPRVVPDSAPGMDSTGETESEKLSLRGPSELAVGGPCPQAPEWKHPPTDLVADDVKYTAHYLGSTHVKELQGTESTLRSIEKLKASTARGAKVPSIILAVSFRGVRFIDAQTERTVCEHEIRNIHCACQDSEDFRHFAYITKDTRTLSHYCHVFRSQSAELASEVILTLGEAFEVAYQLALKDQKKDRGTRPPVPPLPRCALHDTPLGPCESGNEKGPPGGRDDNCTCIVSNGGASASTGGSSGPSSSPMRSDSGLFSDRGPETPLGGTFQVNSLSNDEACP